METSAQQCVIKDLGRIAPGREDEDDPSPDDEDQIGDQWEKLTDEILRLESIRRNIIQFLPEQTQAPDGSAENVQRLLHTYDQRIRSCEEKLEDLIGKSRNGSVVCGIAADQGR